MGLYQCKIILYFNTISICERNQWKLIQGSFPLAELPLGLETLFRCVWFGLLLAISHNTCVKAIKRIPKTSVSTLNSIHTPTLILAVDTLIISCLPFFQSRVTLTKRWLHVLMSGLPQTYCSNFLMFFSAQLYPTASVFAAWLRLQCPDHQTFAQISLRMALQTFWGAGVCLIFLGLFAFHYLSSWW